MFLQNLVKNSGVSAAKSEVTWVKCRSAFVLKVAFLTASVAVCPNAALHLMRRPAMPTRRRWKAWWKHCPTAIVSTKKWESLPSDFVGSYDLTWLTICIFMRVKYNMNYKPIKSLDASQFARWWRTTWRFQTSMCQWSARARLLLEVGTSIFFF